MGLPCLMNVFYRVHFRTLMELLNVWVSGSLILVPALGTLLFSVSLSFQLHYDGFVGSWNWGLLGILMERQGVSFNRELPSYVVAESLLDNSLNLSGIYIQCPLSSLHQSGISWSFSLWLARKDFLTIPRLHRVVLLWWLFYLRGDKLPNVSGVCIAITRLWGV